MHSLLCCVCSERTVDPEDHAEVLGLPAHPDCVPADACGYCGEGGDPSLHRRCHLIP